MKVLSTLLAALILTLGLATAGHAHCEIPCGIYDDSARVDMLNEHITTIEKSMAQITELSAAADKNYNQLVRWVTNKDDHADKFQEIVSQYFLTQRIKPVDPGADGYTAYQRKTELLHRMLVEAMKCKQTTDPAHTEALRKLVGQFAEAYFQGHSH